MPVTLNTAVKPKPHGDDTQDPGERRHIEATGDTYEQAYATLMALVPEGWLAIGISRW